MTILRRAEHTALSTVELSGKTLDLGGDKRSEYKNLFKGTFTITTVDINPKAMPDMVSDLEKPLPLPNASYENVLLINVLEHIYEFKQLLAESARVLVPEGKIVIIVPYMFPYHPSPGDFYRFSAETLKRLLAENGFSNPTITPLGSGVLAARWLFIERLLPSALQSMLGVFMHPLVHVADACLSGLAHAFHKSYEPSDYALGFQVVGIKER